VLARIYLQAANAAHDPKFFIKAEKTARTVLEMRADSKDATLVLPRRSPGKHHFATQLPW